jgi:hypothetical protein
MDGFDHYTQGFEGPDWKRGTAMEIKKIDWGDLMKVAPVGMTPGQTAPKQEPVLTIQTLVKVAEQAAAASSSDGLYQTLEKSLRDVGWMEPEKPTPIPIVGLDIETAPTNDEVTEALKAGATIKW